jgi:hypothetical protein
LTAPAQVDSTLAHERLQLTLDPARLVLRRATMRSASARASRRIELPLALGLLAHLGAQLLRRMSASLIALSRSRKARSCS